MNIAGIKAIMSLIPCWAIHKCSQDDRSGCEASGKGKACRNTNCRECEVYGIIESEYDVKSLIRKLVP